MKMQIMGWGDGLRCGTGARRGGGVKLWWRGEIVVEGWNCGGEVESLECGLGVCGIWWYID